MRKLFFILLLFNYLSESFASNLSSTRSSNGLASKYTTPELLKAFLSLTQYKHMVHSNNLANINTPGFEADDVAVPKTFEDLVDTMAAAKKVMLARTSSKHLAGSRHNSHFKSHKLKNPYEIKPNGNNVSATQQLKALSQNNTAYNMALKAYTSSNNLINVALGK